MSFTSRAASHTPPAVSVSVLCIGGLGAALTQTAVLPIQSEFPEFLDTSASNAAWVVTVTLLAGAVSMVVMGRLADLLGKQPILVAATAFLALGSAVCAMSDSLAPMLVGRTLQGFAMGFIPVGISLIREITPPHMASTAVAAMSATLGVGGAIGLPLAAWIADVADWHAMFWVSTGVALVVLALVVLAVPHVHDAVGGRLDVIGAVGLAVGLVAFLVGISKAPSWGWGSPRTIGAIVIGLIVLVGWAYFELRQDDPLVDLRTSARLPILMTNVAAVAVGFGMMAQAIVIPQLLQLPTETGYGLGQSILQAGLWMAPGGLMMLVFAPVSGTLITKAGAKVALMIGATVLAAGYVVGTMLDGTPLQLLVVTCVASAGVGIGYAAMPTLILDNAPAQEAGAAVGLNALSRSVGTTLAAAVMGTILTSSTTAFGPVDLPSEKAFTLCFAAGAAAALLGVLLASFIPGRARASAEANAVGVATGAAAEA
jgi:MFS family permease